MSHAKTRLVEIKSVYGRSKYPPPPVVSAEVRDAPRCAKCRNLTTAATPACSLGHSLDVSQCGSFSDASRQRDFFPHFFHQDVRR